MNVLSLFSGIGALDLGLQRAGMTIVGQVEIDPFCQRVLAKHWPEVPRHDDVRTCVTWWRTVPRPQVDIVAGGFPCQPVSLAGRRRGDTDERWLWPAMWQAIRDLRPEFAVLENVPGILAGWAGRVLGDLAEIGYDARWDCVPASAVGAPHRRDRWWCVAWLADADREGQPQPGRSEPGVRGRAVDSGQPLADAHGPTRGVAPAVAPTGEGAPGQRAPEPRRRDQRGLGQPWPRPETSEWWTPQSGMGGDPSRTSCGLDRGVAEPWERGVPRTLHDVPNRQARLRAIGNAIVPQVAEHVGRIVMAMAATRPDQGGDR